MARANSQDVTPARVREAALLLTRHVVSSTDNRTTSKRKSQGAGQKAIALGLSARSATNTIAPHRWAKVDSQSSCRLALFSPTETSKKTLNRRTGEADRLATPSQQGLVGKLPCHSHTDTSTTHPSCLLAALSENLAGPRW